MSFTPGSFHASLASPSSFLFTSRSRHHIIEFAKGWRQGPIEDWYQNQSKDGCSTKFRYLEYRKEREPPFYHEYILVDLGNNTVCRFDRRGIVDSRLNALVGESMPTADTAIIIRKGFSIEYTEIYDKSDLLASMHFSEGKDLLIILAVCFGIQSHNATKLYSLTRYNCHFFSWMIVMGLTRHCSSWKLLAQNDSLWTELVMSISKKLDCDYPRLGVADRLKVTVPVSMGLKTKTHQTNSVPYTGSGSLTTLLKEELLNAHTREKIMGFLGHLFQSNIENEIHDLFNEGVQATTRLAIQTHASQAAGAAAVEAVIGLMWRDELTASKMDFWEHQCQLAKDCAIQASEMAEGTLAIGQTETIWDQSWDQSWTTGYGSATQLVETSGGHSSELIKTCTSTRAKSAWISAWASASQANKQYAALITSTVMEYINVSIPGAPVNFYVVPKPGMRRNMAKALVHMDDSPTPNLQDWIKDRIHTHCQRVARVYPKARQPNQAEFEEVMENIWKLALTCLASID